MAGRFVDKVAIITGAASGIGRATAIKLASEGALLGLFDINADALASLAQSLPAARGQQPGQQQAHLQFTVDVGSSAACAAAVGRLVAATGGRLDCVLNCAGVNPLARAVVDSTDADFDRFVNTNLRGPYNVIRAVAPHLRPGAGIVNVASTLGLRAHEGYAIYCATKFGLIGLTRAVSQELGPRGVRVNVVAPGPIDTPTMAGNVSAAAGDGGAGNAALAATISLGRIGRPDEVASVVAFLFADESSYVSGGVVEVHGGLKI